MWKRELKFALGFAVIAAFAMSGDKSYAQGAPDPNAAPNPYKLDEGWAKLPEGRKFGAMFGLSIDRDGKSLWAFDRCETTNFCAGSNLYADLQIRRRPARCWRISAPACSPPRTACTPTATAMSG